MSRSLQRLANAYQARALLRKMKSTAGRNGASAQDERLADAYAACRRYLRSAREPWGAFGILLPPAVRPHVDALFAFTVYGDDLADDPHMSPAERVHNYRNWCELLAAVQDGYECAGRLDWCLCRAFADTIAKWEIAPRSVTAYLDAVGADATFREFDTRADFERYFDDVPAPTMAWLNRIFEGTSSEAEPKSRAVAAANQLTDFLVDMREDLAQGRLYLPLSDLARFDVDRSDLERAAISGRTPPEVRSLVLFEVACVREQYRSAAGWASLVAPWAREAVGLMEIGWERRLAQIERHDGDLFGPAILAERARVDAARSSRHRPVSSRDHADATPDTEPRNSAALPLHVGIITDGNRRWAKEHGVPTRAGHDRGADVLSKIALELLTRGVRYISVYGFSTENWSRAPEEVNDLMDVVADFARRSVYDLHDINVRVRFLGRKHGLPGYVNRAMDGLQEWTADNDGGTLAVCLNYGGQLEITDAVTAMLASGITPTGLSPQDLAGFLYAPDIPPMDLIVRTGGEQRLSNFMLWRAAYAELAFVPTLWPDFTAGEMNAVLDDYARRARRFGT